MALYGSTFSYISSKRTDLFQKQRIGPFNCETKNKNNRIDSLPRVNSLWKTQTRKRCSKRGLYSITFSQSKHSVASLKMASPPSEIIEHIVLFKVKDDTDPSKIETMIHGLKSLSSSIDNILYLNTGPIHKNLSSSALTFTHLFHSRFNSKQDLENYLAHPSHIAQVDNVSPICEDIMVMDWVNPNLNGPVSPKSGSAMRVTFMKLKEGVSDGEKHDVFTVAKGLKGYFTPIEQSSVGVNFELERSKGFTHVAVSMCAGIDEVAAADSGMPGYLKTCKFNPKTYLECDVGVYYVMN